MKQLRINLTVDEQNVLIKSKKSALMVIKILLVWVVVVIGCEIYLLLKK